MRPDWSSVPVAVRTAVEELIGFAVVRTDSQSGGFSPGVAAVVHGASGERAFVKAVSAEVNAVTPGMHRAEARWTALLPADHPSPRLLGVVDADPWVALALEAVDGRQPGRPWTDADLSAAVDAIRTQASVPAAGELPRVQTVLGEDFRGWAQLKEESACLTSWEDRYLADLVALEAQWEVHAEGDRWLHCDTRADNMLVRPDGSVVLVDWPWSCRGTGAFDGVTFIPSAVRDGALGVVAAGADVLAVPTRALGEACEELLARVAPEAPADAVDAWVAALAGYFQRAMRQPPPPGMPTVRTHQAGQGRVACAWLGVRRGWR